MQSKWANADSHVHISWKLHSQGPAGAAIGEASGADAGAEEGAEAGAAPKVRLRFIAFLNRVLVLCPEPLRDASPQANNRIATAT